MFIQRKQSHSETEQTLQYQNNIDEKEAFDHCD